MKIYVKKDDEILNEEDWEKVYLPDALSMTLQEKIELESIVKDRIVLESEGIRIFTQHNAWGDRKGYCIYLKKE